MHKPRLTLPPSRGHMHAHGTILSVVVMSYVDKIDNILVIPSKTTKYKNIGPSMF